MKAIPSKLKTLIAISIILSMILSFLLVITKRKDSIKDTNENEELIELIGEDDELLFYEEKLQPNEDPKKIDEWNLKIVNNDMISDFQYLKQKNKVLNEQGIISADMTQEFADEIEKNYLEIMSLTAFDFSNLESVKKLLQGKHVSIFLRIDEDIVGVMNEDRYEIAYAEPDVIRTEYERVMGRIADLSYTDALINGPKSVEVANKKKDALRQYIRENNIEDVDISIPQVEIDYQLVETVSEYLINMYGEEHTNKSEIQTRIFEKIKNIYAEMITERQVIKIADLIGEELQELGTRDDFNKLYIQKDFAYIGDKYSIQDGYCIYATEEAISRKIESIDKKNLRELRDFNLGIIKEKLIEYAEKNDYHIPGTRFKSEKKHSDFDTMSRITEGIKEAIDVVEALMQIDPQRDQVLIDLKKKGKITGDPAAFMLLEDLDDMNIRGWQLVTAYKMFNGDANRLAEAIRTRSKEMVDYINGEMATVGEEKNRPEQENEEPEESGPTEAEILEQREQDARERAERLANEEAEKRRQIEQIEAHETRRTQEQMDSRNTAETPAKKKGQKSRDERIARRQEYRESLVSKGNRKRIEDLDRELAELQKKKERADKLLSEYEQQLADTTRKGGERE